MTGLKLGDLRPSPLLMKLRALAGPENPEKSEKLFKAFWMDKFPLEEKNILIVSEGDLNKLSAMADILSDLNSTQWIVLTVTMKT